MSSFSLSSYLNISPPRTQRGERVGGKGGGPSVRGLHGCLKKKSVSSAVRCGACAGVGAVRARVRARGSRLA